MPPPSKVRASDAAPAGGTASPDSDDEEELEQAEAIPHCRGDGGCARGKEAELHRRLADFEQSLEERFAQFQLEVGQEIEEN